MHQQTLFQAVELVCGKADAHIKKKEEKLV